MSDRTSIDEVAAAVAEVAVIQQRLISLTETVMRLLERVDAVEAAQRARG